MDKLQEVDFILAQLEDAAHGEESKKVGMARKLISELITSNGAKPKLAEFSELNEAVSIIQTLMQYGNIRPIEGVVYSAGTHKEFLEKAAKWLLRNRS